MTGEHVFVAVRTDDEGEAFVHVFSTWEKAAAYCEGVIRETFYEEGELYEGCPDEQKEQIESALEELKGDYFSVDFGGWDCPLRLLYIDEVEVDR